MSAEDVRIVRDALNEAARAVTEPRRFHANEDERQQALGQAVATGRAALAHLEARLARLERIEEAARQLFEGHKLKETSPGYLTITIKREGIRALKEALVATEEGAE